MDAVPLSLGSVDATSLDNFLDDLLSDDDDEEV